MSDPPDRPGGRHRAPPALAQPESPQPESPQPESPQPAPRPAWDVLADARSAVRSGEDREPIGTGRRARLWSEVFDRLPARGQRVALDLGRHWWLPVVAAMAALTLTVAIAVRTRPTAAAAVPSTGSITATRTTGAIETTGAIGSPTPSASRPSSGSAPAAAPSLSIGAGGRTTSGGTGAAPAMATGRATPTPAIVVVDVAGRVHHPGVVRLPAGSRIVDAIRAAGGSLPRTDLTPLDLAQPLRDGEQVRVGLPGAAVIAATDGAAAGPATTAAPAGGSAAPAVGPAAADTPTSPVDLNTASAAALDELPGIGPVLASRIIAWRTAHGPFGTVDDLEAVPGIGPVSLEKLRPLVTIGP